MVRTSTGDRICRTKKGVVVGDRVNVDAYRVLSTYPRNTCWPGRIRGTQGMSARWQPMSILS